MPLNTRSPSSWWAGRGVGQREHTTKTTRRTSNRDLDFFGNNPINQFRYWQEDGWEFSFLHPRSPQDQRKDTTAKLSAATCIKRTETMRVHWESTDCYSPCTLPYVLFKLNTGWITPRQRHWTGKLHIAMHCPDTKWSTESQPREKARWVHFLSPSLFERAHDLQAKLGCRGTHTWNTGHMLQISLTSDTVHPVTGWCLSGCWGRISVKAAVSVLPDWRAKANTATTTFFLRKNSDFLIIT